MADTNFPVAWGTTTALDVTNLHSLADGNIWGSEAIAPGSPTSPILQISYNLVTNAAMTAGEYIALWVINSDGEATTPYYPASIVATQAQITAAANIAEALAACGPPNKIHAWQTSHGTTFRGLFLYYYPRTAWKVLVRPVGEAFAASGNLVRYRYGTPQGVAV